MEREENHNNNLPEEFETKQTEIGEIPENWEVGTLKDLCDIVNNTCQPKDNSSLVYVGLEHIDTGSFFLNRFGSPNEVVSSKNKFSKNDVLYGKLRPYLDKAIVADSEGICSTDILVFRHKKNIPPLFLLSILHSSRFMNYAIQTTHGVNHPRTSWKSLQFFKLGIPPLLEQNKISEVLYNIQKAIEAQDAVIKTTQELKKSTMQHLFTHGIHGEKTKQTEIGEVPKGWRLEKTEAIFKLTSGKTRPYDLNKKFSDLQTYPVYGGNGIMGFSNNFFEEGKFLVLGRVGEYCGAVHIAQGKIWITDNALYSKEWIDDEVDKDFAAYYIDYFQLNRYRRKSSQPLITQGIVSDILIPVPKLAEQEFIVKCIKKIDDKISLLKQKKSYLQQLFDTMLNKLMMGEIRIKV